MVGGSILHYLLVSLFGAGSTGSLWVTDIGTTLASAAAALGCLLTALRERDRHNRIAWFALAFGTSAWFFAALTWCFRELVMGSVAPAPSVLDVPFFLLAPTFAAAIVFYRGRRPTRRLQLRQIADLGILTATVAIAGTLVLAPSIRISGFQPYLLVAIGYPGFYLAVVLAALASLSRGAWGRRRIVLGILIWANLAFAAVDLLYGAKVLVDVYQTGIEDSLWIVGFLSMCWAAAEERALLAEPHARLEAEKLPSWNAVVGAIALIALAGLCGDAMLRLEGLEWTVIGLAGVVLGAFVAIRMWTGERAEDAYLDAVAVGEEKDRELSRERTNSSRLRAVSSMAGGTAHELNNLLQGITGSLALLQRRAARGEDVSAYVEAIERTLARVGEQVDDLRNLTPPESASGMILILPGGDRDGRLAAVLAEAGFAPASLPDLETAQRAAKGPGVRALIASHEEACALIDRGFTLPIIRRDSDNILDAVVAVVELVSEDPGF